MNGAGFVVDVHCNSMDRGFVLHAIVKLKYIYFYAYGIPEKYLARYACKDVVDGKVSVEEAVERITSQYTYYSEVKDGTRVRKQYPKKHQHPEKPKARVKTNKLRRLRAAIRSSKGDR